MIIESSTSSTPPIATKRYRTSAGICTVTAMASLPFEVERTGSYSTLFADFDDKSSRILQAEYDHGMLIQRQRPALRDAPRPHARTGGILKLKQFDRPTSVENLAHQLFTEITEMGFRLQPRSPRNRHVGGGVHS